MVKPYVIFTPDFDVTSGGIRVMWGLYGWLLAKGQIAAVNATFPNTDYIAIYPEIVNGNPLGAKHVVRYILNKPGVMASHGVPGPTEFDPNDKLYYFSRLFGDANEYQYMFLPILDLNTFTDTGKKRTKTAVFFGKGGNLGLHPEDAIVIDRALAQDQQKLADVLNECHTLYGYDPVSAMYEIARLCGCKVVLHNPFYTKDEFSKYEPGMNGITWGFEPTVPLDVEGFRKHYMMMRILFGRHLDDFIEATQKL